MEFSSKIELEYLNALKIFSGEIKSKYNNYSMTDIGSELDLYHRGNFIKALSSIGILQKQGFAKRATFNKNYNNSLNISTIKAVTKRMQETYRGQVPEKGLQKSKKDVKALSSFSDEDLTGELRLRGFRGMLKKIEERILNI